MRNSTFVLSVLFLTTLTLCGCSGSNRRSGITGTVTLGGTVLSEGNIIFTPIDAQSGDAAIAGAQIANGKYAIDATPGLVPGDYMVSFVATRNIPGKTKKITGTSGKQVEVPVTENIIPDDYGIKTEQKVTVTQGRNRYDFDIPALTEE
ncbi:MAG: hypothetical protein Q4G68_02610 [Planctomycetia bacterium]|nr:hypothetical protein [Planctomycetia bacterium]